MKNSAYARKLQSPLWQKKRLEVLNAANFTCQECKSTEKQLHVHHCYYLKGREPWECDPVADETMFKALCEECHSERQDIEHDVKLEFSRMLSLMTTEQVSDFMVEVIGGKNILTQHSKLEECDSIGIYGDSDVEYMSSIRWFHEAWDNPAFAEIYTKVTGYSVRSPK